MPLSNEDIQKLLNAKVNNQGWTVRRCLHMSANLSLGAALSLKELLAEDLPGEGPHPGE